MVLCRSRYCLLVLQRKGLLPAGSLREDQMSCAPQSGLMGGQLITGHDVFPDNTGPRPLLFPATAIKTVGIPSPEIQQEFQLSLYF